MDSTKTAESALERTGKIIDLYGPRLCGSEGCHKAADFIHKELKEVCDETKIEEFEVNPRAFLGWIRVMDVVYLIALILSWFNLSLFGAVLTLLVILTFTNQIILYNKFGDWLYSKKTGKNVIGVIEPKKEAKQTIIYSGHHDSAYVWGFYESTPKIFLPRAGFALGSFIIFTVTLIIETVIQFMNGISLFDVTAQLPSISRKINIVWSVLVPIVFTSWNFAKDEGTPGAGDNLISTSVGIELAKHYSKNKLENTRVVIISYDGEECGLRGSRAFWDAHAEDAKKMPTYNFNVDSPFFLSEFTLLLSDINGFLPYDEEMIENVSKAADDKGIKITKKNLLFMLGGTDGAEATRHGVKATSLIGLPWTAGDRTPVYHTSLDTVDAIEPKAISALVELSSQLIENMDKKVQ